MTDQEHISVLNADIAELRQRLTWKPIVSAPKDGSHILLFAKENGVIVIGFWGQYTNLWCAYGIGALDYLQRATHWLEIPEP